MPRTPFREGAGHYDAQVEVEVEVEVEEII